MYYMCMERGHGFDRLKHGAREAVAAEAEQTPEQREYVRRERLQLALMKLVREHFAQKSPGMPESDTYAEAMHAWLGTHPDDPRSLAAQFDRIYEEMRQGGEVAPDSEDAMAVRKLFEQLSVS